MRHALCSSEVVLRTTVFYQTHASTLESRSRCSDRRTGRLQPQPFRRKVPAWSSSKPAAAPAGYSSPPAHTRQPARAEAGPRAGGSGSLFRRLRRRSHRRHRTPRASDCRLAGLLAAQARRRSRWARPGAARRRKSCRSRRTPAPSTAGMALLSCWIGRMDIGASFCRCRSRLRNAPAATAAAARSRGRACAPARRGSGWPAGARRPPARGPGRG